MPRRRQQKVLAPVPEDEELVEESSEENLKGIEDAVMQLIDGLEQQGKRFGLCTYSPWSVSNVTLASH
jgi:hypothetical protein